MKAEHFTKDALRDPGVLAMAARVAPVLDATLQWDHALPTAVVQITLQNGASVERRVTSPLGSPSKPMTWDDIATKFTDCARLARRKLSEDRVKSFATLVRGLEEVKDIREILACVA